MALSLSLVDDADGTGATATIAGADVGATVTIYTQSLRVPSWQSAGSRTGNGTLALALDGGLYFAYATGNVSSTPAVSPVRGPFVVTSGTTSVYERILDAVEDEIYTLANAGSLTGFAASTRTVLQQPKANLAIASYPAIFLTPNGVESKFPGNNNRDDWGRPVLLSIYHEGTISGTDIVPKVALWRERLMRHFHRKRLTAVSEVYDCDVNPQSILEVSSPANNPPRPTLLSAMTLNFKTREPRTF